MPDEDYGDGSGPSIARDAADKIQQNFKLRSGNMFDGQPKSPQIRIPPSKEEFPAFPKG